MNLHLILLGAVIALCGTAATTPADEPQTIAPAALNVAIEQLGSSDFNVRQRATSFLWQAGKAAESKLRLAASSDDPETRLRSQSILDDFRYGVFASTPNGVASLVRRYRRDQTRQRDYLWQELLKQASTDTLVAIASTETEISKRRQVLARLEIERQIELAVQLAEKWRGDLNHKADLKRLDDFIRKQIPYFLAESQFEKAESLLEEYATDSQGIRNWAVYLLLCDKIAAEIASVQLRLAETIEDSQAQSLGQRQLVHLHRVNGEPEKALAVARQLAVTDNTLLRDLLFDQRAWAELAEMNAPALAENNDDVEALGFASAYNRLSGNIKAYDANIEAIRDYARLHSTGNSIEYYREALYLNGFTDEAIQLLNSENAVEAFNVQLMRKQYADAFDAAGIGLTRESRETWLRDVVERADGSRRWRDSFQIALRLAGFLATVGEQDESAEMFSQIAGIIKNSSSDGIEQLRQLAEAEVQAKMIDEAFEHAAQAYDKDHSTASVTLLFTKHRTAAKTWWEIYNTLFPNESTRERLLRLRQLFYRQNNQEEVVSLIKESHERITRLSENHASRLKWLHAVGEAYLIHQQGEDAVDCFEAIGRDHSPAAIQMADLLRQQEKWREAGEWYLIAWESTRQPYTLYLYGDMQSKANNDDSGTETKQLARLIPLATLQRYEGLASQLAQRRYIDAAHQESELLQRCSTWSDLQMFHAIGTLSQAVAASDPLQAAAYSEQRMLNCLQKAWHFTDQASYVRIPFEVHQSRAKGLLEQDRLDEAIAELRTCQRVWPAELNLPEYFVPRLDQAGRTTAADELFTVAYEHLATTCEMFPNSALHHNNAAWLSAKCGRLLDKALTQVNRALELVPNEPQYIDTLGEVHFQQGNIDKAIECAKRCVELEPNTQFYQEQLVRFEAARQQPEK